MYKIAVKTIFAGMIIAQISGVAQADIFNRQSSKSDNIFNSSPKKSEDSTESASHAQTNDESSPSYDSQKSKSKPAVENEQKKSPSTNVYPFYLDAARYCSHEWSSQSCMKTLSGASLVMVSNYAEDLHKNKNGQYLESLKQHCAASTAGTKVEVPAYAQRSAMTECINHIVTINEKTGIKPNPDFYQLIVGAIMCFDKNPSCSVIENSLDNYLSSHEKK